MPKCQVLEDEILARLEGRSECFRESRDDLEHRAESARDYRAASTTAWVDGVLANDNPHLSAVNRPFWVARDLPFWVARA